MAASSMNATLYETSEAEVLTLPVPSLDQFLRERLDGPYDFLHFKQPIIDIQNSRVLGYEVTTALLSRGHLSTQRPNTLADRMVNTSMREAFDLRLVREVAANVVNRDSEGRSRWFVNVSTPTTLKKLDRVFTNPSRVVLECSIPAILDDDDQASVRSHLQSLRDLGFRIALEPDCKQRYNGPLISSGCTDYIKTSPALLSALIEHNNSAMKGNAVYWLELARQHQLGLIGFGLECIKQLNTLVMLDVHFAQGYSLQRPVPVYNGRRQ